MESNGVSGLAARPTLSPSSRIWAISSAVRPTSTWTVQPSAPASRNGSRYQAGSVIIRWVSKKRSVCSRSDETTGGPMVRLGTKCPSMTSTWSHSEPGAIWSTASDRQPKSAERIDGATRNSGSEVGVTMAGEPTGDGGSHPESLTGRGVHAVPPGGGVDLSAALRVHRHQTETGTSPGHHVGALDRAGWGRRTVGGR